MSEFGTPETPSYMGMAERLRRMQNKTPDRFRREPGPKPEPWVGRKRATQVKIFKIFFRFFRLFKNLKKNFINFFIQAQTPKFARNTKASKLRALREQNHSKTPKTGRKVAAGAPKFATEARAKMKPKYEEPELPKFKAQPIRHYKNVANTSRLSTASSTVRFIFLARISFSFFSRER